MVFLLKLIEIFFSYFFIFYLNLGNFGNFPNAWVSGKFPKWLGILEIIQMSGYLENISRLPKFLLESNCGAFYII